MKGQRSMALNDARQKKTLSERQKRSDKGKPQLTQRDLDILRIIGEQTAYRFDQLQGLLARHPMTHSADPAFLSETRTMVMIRRWQQLGLADYRKILHDQEGWVWLTAKGIAHLQVPVRFHEPFHGDLEHLYWINETLALIEDRDGAIPGFRWESERLIRATRERLLTQQKQGNQVDRWLPLEYQCQHRPDGLLRYQVGQNAKEYVIAIEVELSHKAYSTWKKIFLELIKYHHEVQYYVHPAITASFTKALERFQNEEPEYGEPSPERRRCISIHDLEEWL
jgi:hypothetical protein